MGFPSCMQSGFPRVWWVAIRYKLVKRNVCAVVAVQWHGCWRAWRASL